MRGMTAKHTTPPSPSRGTCSGVAARPQPRTKKNGVFSCTNADDQLGSPPCITEGAEHTQGNTAEAGMGGTDKNKDPRPGMARDKHQKGHLPGLARTEQRRQGRQDHMRCTHTDHTTPPSPNGGTCSGVPAGPQLHRGAVFSCQYTGRPIGPRHGKCGQMPRKGSSGTGHENAT